MTGPTIALGDLRHNDPRLDRRLAANNPAPHEVAVLVRSGLMFARASTLNLIDTPMRSWDTAIWQPHGLLKDGDTLTLTPWQPSWLDTHGGAPPDEPVSRRARRRLDGSVPADRFYEGATGQATAKTLAQRDALRATALAGPGDTVICVLPTGSGKTDVVLTRAIRYRPQQAIIIVPTVSLAIDLERRVQDFLKTTERFAYYGAADGAIKDRIHTGIAAGSQWLTIAGPEAACLSLARPLLEAANRGTLDMIVIDEAHIVAEWGDAFRPAFHTFAGLRQRLLAVAPDGRQATTVLLTGTLDTYGLATLTRLFPGRNRLIVSGQATRPEPAWWNAHCATENEKRDRLIEALRHLPRPALVYTTLHTSERSTNTKTVQSWLRKAGFRSTIEIADNPSPQRRQAAVAGLRLSGPLEDDLDVVVATSAFGLGIDIPDIRTVIHACVPETIDRLYQEVGRSGRDGLATTSLVLWTAADMALAESISHERLLGVDLAWRRWKSMRNGKWSGTHLTVDLRADHAGVKYPSSDANIYWNIQTLSAMDRAKMVRRQWPIPENVPDDADDDTLEVLFDNQRSAAAVEVLQSDLDDESTFKTRFAAGQRSARSGSAAALAAATHLVRGLNECTNRYLARNYQVEDESGDRFPVSVACGGCPHCRRIGSLPRSAPMHHTLVAGTISMEAHDDLRALSVDRRLSVRFDAPDPAAVRSLVDRLIRRGIVVVAALSSTAWTSRSPNPWWQEDIASLIERRLAPWRVPTLLIVDHGLDDTDLARALTSLTNQTLGVVLTPTTRRDPRNPKQFLHEAWTPSYDIYDLLRKV
ncbi:protein DpdF [Micromonospora sp. NBC_01699]|uniref:protein DpdF n=1 Tax=Micromonospora sp. NBC_01699 TaxID=2975984 RepID=UPI002E28A59F|nr:protein DpdF [Micromonospora sp. NBC_01699]